MKSATPKAESKTPKVQPIKKEDGDANESKIKVHLRETKLKSD